MFETKESLSAFKLSHLSTPFRCICEMMMSVQLIRVRDELRIFEWITAWKFFLDMEKR